MTRQAYDLNSGGFRAGTNGPLVIAASCLSPEAAGEIDGLASELRSQDGVAFVTDPIVNRDGSAAIVTVIPQGIAPGRRDGGSGPPTCARR